MSLLVLAMAVKQKLKDTFPNNLVAVTMGMVRKHDFNQKSFVTINFKVPRNF